MTGNLARRAEIIRAIRAFFDARGFVEVTTPVRISAPAPEPHIDCPPVLPAPVAACAAAPTPPVCTYLRASPEIEMKKLLAAGMDRIYQIGPCFREGECGSRHHPEFTMIEWYRRNADYRDIMADTKELLASLIGNRWQVTGNEIGNRWQVTGNTKEVKNSTVSPVTCHLSPSVMTVRQAYRELAGWDPWTDWNQDRFDYDMATKIEPNLPEGPVFLTDYPPQAASLAKLRGDVAERWELYWKGIELANCFTELCDADEQRRRFLAAKAERQALGESDYPIDGEFLEMLPLIGSASGVALGVDRLVMLLCGERDIHAVM